MMDVSLMTNVRLQRMNKFTTNYASKKMTKSQTNMTLSIQIFKKQKMNWKNLKTTMTKTSKPTKMKPNPPKTKTAVKQSLQNLKLRSPMK